MRARREGNEMGVRSAYDIARRVCTQPGQGLNSNWSGIRLGKVGRWKEGGRGRGEGEKGNAPHRASSKGGGRKRKKERERKKKNKDREKERKEGRAQKIEGGG